MQLARGSLGILRDEIQQIDVLKIRRRLPYANIYSRLLIFNLGNALPD